MTLDQRPSAPISVVMPNYNDAEYLPAALEGVVGQTLLPQEIIIIDDASTDNSLEVIKEWQKRYPDLIHVYRNEENKGVLFTMERGYNLARFDYFYCHSADDLILPACFEKYYTMLERHPDAGLAFSPQVTFRSDPNDRVYPNDYWTDEPGFCSPEAIAENIKGGWLCCQILYRRKLIQEVGGFQHGLRNMIDWFWMFTIAFRYGVCFVPDTLCLFRLRDAAYSARMHRDKDERKRIHETFLKLIQQPAFADVLPRYAQSGVVRHLGPDLAGFVLGRPEWWTPTVFGLIQSNIYEWNQDLRNTHEKSPDSPQPTVEGQLKRKLPELIELFGRKKFRKIAIYGAGSHSEVLLSLWKALDGPPCELVITSEPADIKEFMSIPVSPVSTVVESEIDAIILSSLSFEREMAASCGKYLPKAPCFTIWGL